MSGWLTDHFKLTFGHFGWLSGQSVFIRDVNSPEISLSILDRPIPGLDRDSILIFNCSRVTTLSDCQVGE